jgi:DNA repair protein RadC
MNYTLDSDFSCIKVNLVREPVVMDRTNTPEDAHHVLKRIFEGADREYFVALHLDTRNKVTGYHVVSIGSLNTSVVHPREVFKAAILDSAAAVVVSHNHPSGNIMPSKEDVELTARLQKAGNILGIEVLDHIIVGDSFYSFKTKGLL